MRPWQRLFPWIQRRSQEEDFKRELLAHIESETQERQDAGVSTEEARQGALRAFGNFTLVTEEFHDSLLWKYLDDFARDIWFAVRSLRKSPGFTLAAALTLGLGIGANTTVFSAVNAVLLRPLPYSNPDRLVVIWQTVPKRGVSTMPVSEPDYSEFASRSQSFDQISALFLEKEQFTVYGPRLPERFAGMNVASNLFMVLGAQPLLGRVFLPEEDQPGHTVVVLSYRFWQKYFGGDSAVLGHTMDIDQQAFTIVGVMPKSFHFPPPLHTPSGFTWGADSEFWVPLIMTRPNRSNHPLAVIARLKRGVTLERARTEIQSIATNLATEYPATNQGIGGTVSNLGELVVHQARPPMLILFAIVCLVLLIACVNVSNLLLARSAARTREIALRFSLGASRGRIVRQWLTESFVLALLGCVTAILIAEGLVALVRSSRSFDIPRLREMTLDNRVFLFTTAIASLSGLMFGLVSVWVVSATSCSEGVKQGSRTAGDRSSRHLRSLLVVAEVALAVVPLIGAGLLIHSFTNLVRSNPGFEPHGILTAKVSLSESQYGTDSQVSEFSDRLVQSLGRLPGVISAATVNSLPIAGFQGLSAFDIEGHPKPSSLSDKPSADERAISPAYFRTMEIPVIEGRAFENLDGANAPAVAIVNHFVARNYFRLEDPIGKQIRIDGDSKWRTIVGVVGDIHNSGLASPPDPEIYLPQSQRPWSSFAVVIRTSLVPSSLANAVRNQIWLLDKEQAVSNIMTMDEVLSDSVSSRRSNLLLFSGFAAAALLLAAVGVYGVVAYSVTQRTKEIGIRIALGATTGAILRIIIREGLSLTLLGAGLGLALSFALSRVMSSFLFNVSATDSVTFSLTATLVVSVALVACLIPAMRAGRVDSIVALREE